MKSSRFRSQLRLLPELILVGSIFFGALIVRLYHLNWPLADWHSFRQADTASVTREYVKNGVDFLRPHYHDLSNIQSGKDNLEGWRMVEFPLINGLIAILLRWQTNWDLVVVSRVFSIAASLLTLGALFSLARDWYGRLVATIAAATFAFLPYSIFYSRSILPEPFLAFFSLATAFCLWQWAKRDSAGWKISLADFWLIGAMVFWAAALLLKPVAIFFAPLYLGVIWRNRRFSLSDIAKLSIPFLVGFVPLWWWRQWIQQFPTGIPAADWLLNGNGIRLRPAWWRWLFADRLGRLMFGYWGTPFVALGAVVGWLELPTPRRWPKSVLERGLMILRQLEAWMQYDGVVVLGLLGMVAYMIVIATGNVQHDYYQFMMVPLLALTWARGVVWMLRRARSAWHFPAMAGAMAAIAVFMVVFAWYEVSGFYHINNPAIVSAGQAVDRFTPPDAWVIAPQFGDTSFLFQTNRRGWPIGFEIDDKIAKGAQFYITTSQDDEANELMRSYPVLEKTSEYILLDLRQKLP